MVNFTCEELALQRCKECYFPFPIGNSSYEEDSKPTIFCPKRIVEERINKKNPDYPITHNYKPFEIFMVEERGITE